MRRLRLAVTTALWLPACAADSSRSDAFVVTDSAGIAIIHNVGGTEVSVAAPVPDLTIGAADGAAHEVFGRVADVDVDRAGTIYVLDAQASEVRVFDAAGSHRRSFGRRGQGPGELSPWVNSILVGVDGRVYVPDPQQRRVNVYDPGGAPQPAIPVAPRPTGQSWVQRSDGSFLVGASGVSRDATGRFAFWEGLVRSRIDENGVAAFDTILAFDFPRTDVGSPDDIRVPVIVNTAFWAPFGEGIAWASLDRTQLHVLSAAGTLQAIIRHDAWRRRPLTTEDERSFRQLLGERLRGLGGDASVADGPIVTFPDSLPAITSVLAGPNGTIWVQRMGAVRAASPEGVNAMGRSRWLGGGTWDVLDMEGRAVRRVDLPAGVTPLRITADAIYGVSVDAQGVQRVVRLPDGA